MSAFQAFQIQEGNLVPFDPPWSSEETLLERLSSVERRPEPAATARDVSSALGTSESIPSRGMLP